MSGYYKLEVSNIKAIHLFLSRLCNKWVKMYINRLEFASLFIRFSSRHSYPTLSGPVRLKYTPEK